MKMLHVEPKDYTVVRIEGEYAYLCADNTPPDEAFFIAMASLPAEIDVGTRLRMMSFASAKVIAWRLTFFLLRTHHYEFIIFFVTIPSSIAFLEFFPDRFLLVVRAFRQTQCAANQIDHHSNPAAHFDAHLRIAFILTRLHNAV